VHKLIQKCSNKTSSSHYFDWKFLGSEAGICFNALPERVTFLAGALDHEVTLKKKAVRKPREKAVVDDSEEVKPETVQNNHGDADKLSAMEKAMRVIKKKLAERTLVEKEKNPRAGEHPDIDGGQFLFNPKSFTQTVENIFNFSFLIKKGDAEIGVRPRAALNRANNGQQKPGLFVAHRSFNADDSVPCTQAVCSFTMADWRRLCAAQNLREGDLPHRTGTKHGRAGASSSQ
jgi:non-structural maintenance of chromosomes element 4